MRKLLLAIILSPTLLLAQTGGGGVYQVLNFPTSPRLAVLNEPISIWDGDVNMGMYNPSLLNPEMHSQLALNFVDYFADINMVSATYAFPFKEVGTVGVSITSLNLGQFTETDFAANTLGTFYANEQLLTAGFGKQLTKRISVGANLKMLLSSLESYQSFGLATDLSATYFNTDNNLAFSFLAQNLGRQITTYASQKEPLPLEVKMGVSKRLEHLPFRFSLGYNHLEKWDLTYASESTTTTDPLTGETIINTPNFGQKMFRHFVAAGELNIGKHIQLRMGYDAQRRHELKVDSFLGMVGFSWGVGIKVSHFYINYGRATYHLVGSPNYFSVSTNLSKFYKR